VIFARRDDSVAGRISAEVGRPFSFRKRRANVEDDLLPDIAVEVVPARAGSGDLSSRPPGPEQLRARIDELTDTLAEVATQMRDQLDKVIVDTAAGWGLDQVQLEFGVALKAKTGVLVVSAEANATFAATITWSPRSAR
jgi:hypothetical protein